MCVDQRKVLAYDAVYSGSLTPQGFVDRCNELIDEGFQPYGHIQASGSSGNYVWQAFVKYEEVDAGHFRSFGLEKVQV
jgi:hypothetical protein